MLIKEVTCLKKAVQIRLGANVLADKCNAERNYATE